MLDMVATRAQRVLLTVIATLGLAVPALADTARVTSPSALVWNQPSPYGVVLAQLPRGTVVDVVKRAGEWYQIVLPVRAAAGAADRSGFMRASQLAIAPGALGEGDTPAPEETVDALSDHRAGRRRLSGRR